MRAGVDVVSHAALLAWEPTPALPDWSHRMAADYAGASPVSGAVDALLRDMAARGTILDATLFVSFARGRAATAGEWAAKVTARARELGVRVSAGTDDLIEDSTVALPNLHEEMALLVERSGFTPLQAIAAATSTAAAALGLRDRGAISAGMVADLVVLQRDPALDIRNTRSIVWVMKHGKRYAPAGA